MKEKKERNFFKAGNTKQYLIQIKYSSFVNNLRFKDLFFLHLSFKFKMFLIICNILFKISFSNLLFFYNFFKFTKCISSLKLFTSLINLFSFHNILLSKIRLYFKFEMSDFQIYNLVSGSLQADPNKTAES